MGSNTEERPKSDKRDWHAIESDPRAAFALATLNLSHAKASERGRLADLIEMVSRVEQVAQARTNNHASAAEVRHVASRVAAAACALAVDGDPRCNLDPCVVGGNERNRVTSPVGAIVVGLLAAVELAGKISAEIKGPVDRNLIDRLRSAVLNAHCLAVTVEASLVVGSLDLATSRLNALEQITDSAKRLATDGELLAAGGAS